MAAAMSGNDDTLPLLFRSQVSAVLPATVPTFTPGKSPGPLISPVRLFTVISVVTAAVKYAIRTMLTTIQRIATNRAGTPDGPFASQPPVQSMLIVHQNDSQTPGPYGSGYISALRRRSNHQTTCEIRNIIRRTRPSTFAVFQFRNCRDKFDPKLSFRAALAAIMICNPES